MQHIIPYGADYMFTLGYYVTCKNSNNSDAWPFSI